jgi:ABC-type transport system involved in cytochrome bd biosynthesis fused ATPase/permease subunit
MPSRPRDLGDDLRTLASSATARRGALVGVVALLERLLTPVIALTLVQRRLGEKVAVTLVFGAIFTGRTLVQRVLSTRTESELVDRTTASVLDGDVLRAEVLPDQDVTVQAAQAIHFTSQMLSVTLPHLVADLVACVVFGVALAALEPPRLVAVAVAVTIAATAALLVSRRAVAGSVERAWRVQERVYEALGHVLEGRLEIVASGQRRALSGRMREMTRAWSAAGARVAAATILSGRLTLAAVAVLVTGALAANAELRGSLLASVADLALFASVTPAFVGVAQGVHTAVRDARWMRLLARIFSGAIAPRQGATREPPPLPAPVKFEAVSFRYGEPERSEEALAAIELSWSGREILALAGANGSGKSTCLRLLLGLAAPTGGAIRVADVPLADLEPDRWRARVAFLPQRPYLPPRSDVRTAVRWPIDEATDERVLGALDRVGLLAALRRAGGDPLAVRVDSLSVGQRQRVALARLLCRDAGLFLLDEPDANLDRAGIQLVAELLRELAARGMVAFAAHTPELLAVAERVVALDRGKLLTG